MAPGCTAHHARPPAGLRRRRAAHRRARLPPLTCYAGYLTLEAPHLYLRAVRETGAVRSPAVVDRLAPLAEKHPDPDHQVHALIALETQHRLEPYLGKLLEVALDSIEPVVRGLALEMGTYPDARIEGPLLQQVMKLQREDPDPDVREMAALVMSAGRDTRAVLEAFGKSFPQEKNECVRWAIVRYAVRAAGAGALPLLKDFATQDARFQRDHTEFKALYDAGHADFDRVFPGKANHHRCGG